MPMKSTIFLILLAVVFQSSVGRSSFPKSAAGIELGGSGTLLFSDPSLQIFGAGAGLQGSLFFSTWNDRPIGAKLRYDVVRLNEVALQKASTSYLIADTSLKSMTQNWQMISVGAEGRFTAQSQSFFWEALLGYAMGAPSTVTVSYAQQDINVVDTSQTTSSAFAVSGGFGIKRIFGAHVTGLMSLRTMFLLAPTYNSSALSSKTIIPLPLMFSVGLESPF